MKRTGRLLFGIIGLLLHIFPFLSGQQPEIEIEKIFELGKGDLLFSSIDSVDEDTDGNFFVLDRSAFKIHKFSPQGELLLSFGSQGQGPGEFQAPHQISVLENGNLVVSEDMAFVSLFDSEGHFIKRLTTERGLALTYLSEDLFYAWLWTEQGRTQHFLDRAGNIQDTFYSVSREAFSVSVPDESGRQVMFNYASQEIAPSLIFSRSKNHTVAAIGDSYQFSVMNLEGEKVSTIHRELKPQKLSAKERNHILNQIEERQKWPDRVLKLIRKNMPAVKSYFDEILISPNFVFVFRIKDDVTDSNSPYPVDLFSLEGDFLGTVQLPFMPLFISDRFLYSAFFDREDDLILQKYGYRLRPR
jgi:hypothetical protein